MSERSQDPEYDGTGTGHERYGDAAYPEGGGKRGEEVAAAMEAELAEDYDADDPGEAHLSERMLRQEQRDPNAVPRFSEDDDAVDAGGNDQFGDITTEEVDADRHDLSAEESAMHYVDEDNDRIPE
jgi:hypothetical protein